MEEDEDRTSSPRPCKLITPATTRSQSPVIMGTVQPATTDVQQMPQKPEKVRPQPMSSKRVGKQYIRRVTRAVAKRDYVTLERGLTRGNVHV